jgi:hypothetical protein
MSEAERLDHVRELAERHAQAAVEDDGAAHWLYGGVLDQSESVSPAPTRYGASTEGPAMAAHRASDSYRPAASAVAFKWAPGFDADAA